MLKSIMFALTGLAVGVFSTHQIDAHLPAQQSDVLYVVDPTGARNALGGQQIRQLTVDDLGRCAANIPDGSFPAPVIVSESQPVPGRPGLMTAGQVRRTQYTALQLSECVITLDRVAPLPRTLYMQPQQPETPNANAR